MSRILAILVAPFETLHAWLGFALVCVGLMVARLIDWLFGLAQGDAEDARD